MTRVRQKILAWLAGVVAAQTVGAAPPPLYVREAHRVVVDGQAETWKLVWVGKPMPVCGEEDVEMAITCPCTGFAYGEAGRVALVRYQGTREIDRLDLGALAKDYDGPPGLADSVGALPRWPMEPKDMDRATAGDPALVADIRARRPVRLMHIADYDGDGHATEFALQVGAMPCGKRQQIIVGISASNPRLHAFTTAEDPSKPLAAGAWVWEALLRGHGRADAVEWPCGDHGSEVESRIEIRADHGLLHAKRSDRSCAPSDR